MEEKKTNSACEYLYAVIVTADWIGEEYKRFAEKFKGQDAILRELYLCICDGVSLDILELAEMNESVEISFRECRRKHLESSVLKQYSDEIKRIRSITTATEKEVKAISGSVRQLADTIPALEESLNSPERKETEHLKEVEADLPKGADLKKIAEPQKGAEPCEERSVVSTEQKDIRNAGFLSGTKKSLSVWIKERTKRSPSDFVSRLYAENYSTEQVTFIIACIEEGMSEHDILRFASPNIPVEIMEKLKKIQERKQKK